MATLWNLLTVVSLLVLSEPQRCSGVDHDSVQAVAEENEGIKRLQNKAERMRLLEESVVECQQLGSNHTNTEKLLSNKVKQFSNTKDWEMLRRCLEAVLDQSSEPYIQLQRIDYNNSYPIFYVGYHGSTQLVSLLLDAGLPVDTAESTGNTMLHGAAAGGQLHMVKLLLDRGASVNVKGFTSWIPLMYAANSGHLEVVKYLVSAGADTTVMSKSYRNALDWARAADRTAVAEYLEQLSQ